MDDGKGVLGTEDDRGGVGEVGDEGRLRSLAKNLRGPDFFDGWKDDGERGTEPHKGWLVGVGGDGGGGDEEASMGEVADFIDIGEETWCPFGNEAVGSIGS